LTIPVGFGWWLAPNKRKQRPDFQPLFFSTEYFVNIDESIRRAVGNETQFPAPNFRCHLPHKVWR
jgi:hypothetical protein